MLQSQFVKSCKKCNASGEIKGFHERMEVCLDCKGVKYVVDSEYLEDFKRKIWEVSSNEIASYFHLIREVDEGIEFLVALNNEPACYREVAVSLLIAKELDSSSVKNE